MTTVQLYCQNSMVCKSLLLCPSLTPYFLFFLLSSLSLYSTPSLLPSSLSLPLLFSSLLAPPQEFVQRDPMQTSNILELLLSRKSQADLLAPLFKPNGCPDQFLHMYGSAAEVAVKDGASIAFSVLTKVG